VTQIDVLLPEASPDQNLRWMAFWREVEDRMLEHPGLASVAGAESAPFLHDSIADYLSTAVVSEFARQARAAKNAGQRVVVPRLSVDADTFARALGYVLRRGNWLQQRGIPEAMGIEPLDEELVRLRSALLVSLQTQLEKQGNPCPAEPPRQGERHHGALHRPRGPGDAQLVQRSAQHIS
jgi:hypothetical protein